MEQHKKMNFKEKRLDFVNELSKHTVSALRVICNDNGVILPKKITKAKLLDALRHKWEEVNGFSKGIFLIYV